jgi:hypothetical protein
MLVLLHAVFITHPELNAGSGLMIGRVAIVLILQIHLEQHLTQLDAQRDTQISVIRQTIAKIAQILTIVIVIRQYLHLHE